MKYLRASVTSMDALRYFMAQEEGDLDKLLRQLRREEPETEPMRRGTAFHDLLEHSPGGRWDRLHHENYGYEFSFEQLDVKLSLPTIRELKGHKVYRLPGLEVTVVGKVDAIEARTTYDHKLTGRFDAERLFAAWQWRFYLEMFFAEKMIYNVFEYREDRNDPELMHVYAFHQFPVYRYPGMEVECQRIVSKYADFVTQYAPDLITDTPSGGDIE